MEIMASYSILAENVPGKVTILRKPEEYTPIYDIKFPAIEIATKVVLDSIKEKLIEVVRIEITEILDPKAMEGMKKRFLV